jgi:hypothetical protein
MFFLACHRFGLRLPGRKSAYATTAKLAACYAEGFQREPAVWHAVGLLADGASHRRFPTLLILTRPQLLRLGIANNGPIFGVAT